MGRLKDFLIQKEEAISDTFLTKEEWKKAVESLNSKLGTRLSLDSDRSDTSNKDVKGMSLTKGKYKGFGHIGTWAEEDKSGWVYRYNHLILKMVTE